jgi:hypothetical protein
LAAVESSNRSQYQDQVAAAYFYQEQQLSDDNDEWEDLEKSKDPDLGRTQALWDALTPKRLPLASLARKPSKSPLNDYIYSSQQKSQIVPEFGGYIDSSDDDSIPQGQLPRELDSARSENAEPSENEELSDQEIEARQSDSSGDLLDIDKLVSQGATVPRWRQRRGPQRLLRFALNARARLQQSKLPRIVAQLRNKRPNKPSSKGSQRQFSVR